MRTNLSGTILRSLGAIAPVSTIRSSALIMTITTAAAVGSTTIAVTPAEFPVARITPVSGCIG
jgi:hypothetical protein